MPANQYHHAITFAASLAWFQLFAEKRRLMAAIAGVGIAAILMLMQLGIRDALFDSGVLHYSQLRADLVMVSSQYVMLNQTGNFSRRRLYQALGQEGVAAVTPLYLSLAPWKNPQTLSERNILIIGFEPQAQPFKMPEALSNQSKIQVPDIVLFDQASRPEFGQVAQVLQREGKVKTEVAGHQLEVGGVFTLGTSFGADGTIIASDATFQRIFPSRQPGVIELGLIQLKPNANILAVRAALEQSLPNDVKVLTHAELIQTEKNYWDANTPIGFVMLMTLLIGFIVGAVILYQILYTDVTDHLDEFATLKAMGYANGHLFLVVLFQAVILAMLSYPMAWLTSAGAYAITHQATKLPIAMTLGRSLLIFLLTIAMCGISGSLAMLRLRSADPAEVF
ncbi:MAG TPA: ABC transporter permease DevC [Blastocatellia bacterium]|nr:ABC transporter permease DevC [Blastocatellia bacterium]